MLKIDTRRIQKESLRRRETWKSIISQLILRQLDVEKGKHVLNVSVQGYACGRQWSLLYIAAMPPVLLGSRMQRHFEMSFRSIPHHLCEGEWGVLCPGDSIFACFESPAKVSDKSVRSILARVDGPAAKIYTWDIT